MLAEPERYERRGSGHANDVQIFPRDASAPALVWAVIGCMVEG